jgi:hypothetical protein
MADKFWESNSDTSWDTAGNWSGGTLPILNDNVFFTGEGTANCYGPVTLADLGTGKITVGPSYSGSLGQSGQHLNVSAAGINYQGRGAEAWFAGDYEDVYVKTPQTGTSAFNVYATGGDDIDDLYVAQGRVNVLSGTAITDMHVRWNKEPRRDSLLYIQSSVTINGELHAEGGYVEVASALSGGSTTIEDTTVLCTAEAGNISEVFMMGGRLDYLGNGSINVIKLGGTARFDVGSNGRAMTIGDLHVGSAAEARTNRGGDVVTYNNPVIVWGNGRFESFQDAATVIRI